MKNGMKYQGAVVPMVTPVTANGALDEPAVDRLVDSLVAGGVSGIFVLGTTGEGAHVPRSFRRQLVRRAASRLAGSCGLGEVLCSAALGEVRASPRASQKRNLKGGYKSRLLVSTRNNRKAWDSSEPVSGAAAARRKNAPSGGPAAPAILA